jgi:hypothetical protein
LHPGAGVVVFLITDIVIGVGWNFNIILICISLIAKDVEYFSCIYWPKMS